MSLSAYPRAFALMAQNSCERASREAMTEAAGTTGVLGRGAAQPATAVSMAMTATPGRNSPASDRAGRGHVGDRNGMAFHVGTPKKDSGAGAAPAQPKDGVAISQ